MKSQKEIDYNRVADAIKYIDQNFKNQPSLEEVANEINLSPTHFQKLFTNWAGVSPKKFLQFLSISYARQSLQTKENTLFDVSNDIGLSSTSRLHDLFVKIEGMTPGEFKNGGINLTIDYQFSDSPFGKILIASTKKGVCHMAFYEDNSIAYDHLLKRFPKANFVNSESIFNQNALSVFNQNWHFQSRIQLHLSGTPFQLKVWEALLRIPFGNLSTYGRLAASIGSPNASRAVGTAIGSNPIAFLIPCHRIIQATGKIGGYMWSPTRKKAMIGWEASKLDSKPSLKFKIGEVE